MSDAIRTAYMSEVAKIEAEHRDRDQCYLDNRTKRRVRLQEIISGIIGGDYIKAGCLDRDRIIKDLDEAYGHSR